MGERFSLTLIYISMHVNITFQINAFWLLYIITKLLILGLNAVETYVPWNLHEHQQEKFDFGAGGSDMEDFLNVTEFLRTAQEEDLLAIVRPGPYICSEFEFGGFPSWLLRNVGIKFRTSEWTYMKFVTR